MAKDSDLLSVSAAAKLVGLHPPQIYKYIEKEGLISHKDKEGHTRVILSELKDFLAIRSATPRARGGSATKRAQDIESVKEYVTPFVKQPVLSLWDRGSDKGWAVAAIKETPEVQYDADEDGRRSQRLVTFDVDYADHDLVWADARLIDEVIAGKIIVAEPQSVLRMLAAQLKMFDPAEQPRNVIDALEDIAVHLDEWKKLRIQSIQKIKET